MNASLLRAELARLEAATPSKFAVFNDHRTARIAELRAILSNVPAEPDTFRDAGAEAQIAKFDASSPKNRRESKWK